MFCGAFTTRMKPNETTASHDAPLVCSNAVPTLDADAEQYGIRGCASFQVMMPMPGRKLRMTADGVVAGAGVVSIAVMRCPSCLAPDHPRFAQEPVEQDQEAGLRDADLKGAAAPARMAVRAAQPPPRIAPVKPPPPLKADARYSPLIDVFTSGMKPRDCGAKP